jgi:hypothetical protein
MVFVEYVSLFRKLAEKDYPHTKLKHAFEEFELIENLNFLAETYQWLAREKKRAQQSEVQYLAERNEVNPPQLLGCAGRTTSLDLLF